MKTNTITNIETTLQSLNDSFENYKNNVADIDKDFNLYGGENEYLHKVISDTTIQSHTPTHPLVPAFPLSGNPIS